MKEQSSGVQSNYLMMTIYKRKIWGGNFQVIAFLIWINTNHFDKTYRKLKCNKRALTILSVSRLNKLVIGVYFSAIQVSTNLTHANTCLFHFFPFQKGSKSLRQNENESDRFRAPDIKRNNCTIKSVKKGTASF